MLSVESGLGSARPALAQGLQANAAGGDQQSRDHHNQPGGQERSVAAPGAAPADMQFPQLDQQLVLDQVVTIAVLADLRRDVVQRVAELRDRVVMRQASILVAVDHRRWKAGGCRRRRPQYGGSHRHDPQYGQQNEDFAHFNNVILPRLPSRRHIAGRALGLLAAIALVLSGAACGGAAKHVKPGSRPPLVSIFEAPAQLGTAPALTLDELQHLGVDYIRVTVPWAALAPDPQSLRPPTGVDLASPTAYAAIAWSVFDAIVRAARDRGIGVILDPTLPAPRWATGSGEPAGGPPGVWKVEAAPFGEFVRALGIRYSGRFTPAGAPSPLPRVSFWSAWNEPNLGVDLAPQAIEHSSIEYSALLYRRLLDVYWTALQQTGHGHDTILFGELDPGGTAIPGPGNFNGTVPLRFVRALYCVDQSLHPFRGNAAAARSCPTTAAGIKRFPAQHPALFHASGVAVHPYSQGALAPNLPTPEEPEYANLAALPKLEGTLDAIQAVYGSGARLPLYSTEYGYKTNPPYIAGAPVAVAPRFLNWAEYISWRDPRIRSYDQYLLADPVSTSASKFDSGLQYGDGSPKPTLAAFRLPIYLPVTRGARGGRLEVWGCLRPARHAFGPGSRSGRIEFSRGATGPFRTVRVVSVGPSSCYFDVRISFPATGFVRLAWRYPSGATIHSRLVSITLR